LARAKNTDRAEARRRFREARAAELSAARGADSDGDEAFDPVTGRRLVEDDAVPETATRPRRSFQIPNVRRDVADLPRLFRERRVLVIPFLLLVLAFVLSVLGDRGVFGDGQVAQIVALYIQFTLPPSALLVFFLGGFLAPRSSYLVGFLLGLVDGILLVSAVSLRPASAVVDPAAPQITADSLIVAVVYAVIIGTFGAAFAAWYRNFLRSNQQRARASQLERDAKRRAAQKEEARAAKRPPKPAAR
jgi:hypothetical protein